MSLFRIPSTKAIKVESPTLLFRHLKRDTNIKFLWGHQEKVLDAYYLSHREARDLALELPTGTGKTLVGFCTVNRNRLAVRLCVGRVGRAATNGSSQREEHCHL